MKTMNLMKAAAAMVVMAMSMASCTKEMTVENGPAKEGKMVEVSLSCGGEILDMGETPLSRAESNDDLYYVQAFRLDREQAGYMCYAHGLFDNMQDMRIELNENDTYFFRATMVEGGKNYVYSQNYNDTIYYFAPFNAPLNNRFEYSGQFDVASMTQGTTIEGVNDEQKYIVYNRPSQFRYYGESQDYIPVKGGTVNIDMARTSFAAGIEVENLKEGESIYVAIDGAPGFTVSYPETTVAFPFSFYDVDAAYFVDRLEDGSFGFEYVEDVLVEIYRIDAEGNVFGVGAKKVEFRRNVIKNLKVTIANSPDGNGINMDVDTEEGWYSDFEDVEFVGGIYE